MTSIPSSPDFRHTAETSYGHQGTHSPAGSSHFEQVAGFPTATAASYVYRANADVILRDKEFGIGQHSGATRWAQPLPPQVLGGLPSRASLHSNIELLRMHGTGADAVVNAAIERGFINSYMTQQMTANSDTRQLRWNISLTRQPPLWEPWVGVQGLEKEEFNEIMGAIQKRLKENRQESCNVAIFAWTVCILTIGLSNLVFCCYDATKQQEKNLIAHLEEINLQLNPRGLGVVYEKIGENTEFIYLR